MTIYVGIDPGVTGAWAYIDSETGQTAAFPFDSYKQFYQHLHTICEGQFKKVFATLEDVHSSPAMGEPRAFAFGDNFGGWKATLEVLEIKYCLVAPFVWQRTLLGRFPAGDSKITAARYTQKKWPQMNFKTTKSDEGRVDAMCIARYGQKITENSQKECISS